MAGTEAEQLTGALDRLRTTFRWKADDLDAPGLQARVGASSLTLGGLLKHLALNEDYMSTTKLTGEPMGAPWDALGFDGSDDEWEFTTAADDTPEQLYALWDDAVERSRMLLLECGGHLPVERYALTREKVGVDRLAGERVAKCKPLSGFLDDELRRDELFDERQQLPLVVIGQHLQQIEVEAAARNRRGGRDNPGRYRERGQSAAYGFYGGVRYTYALQRARPPMTARRRKVAGDDQRLERFLDKERVALGEVVQQLHEFLAKVFSRSEDRPQHCSNIVSSKRLDREVVDDARSLEIGNEPRESRPSFFTPIRKCEHDGL